MGSLKSKRITSENYQWRYIEGGDKTKPTILFVHGFAGSKSLWRTMMQFLAKDFQVIAVDMPGLYSGLRTYDKRYDFPRLAACLHEFICAKNLNYFHLVGHSLGANVSAVYAARYQSRIASLALISLLAVGQKSQQGQLSRFAEFKQHLMCRDVHALKSLMEMLYYRPPSIPETLLEFKLKEIKQYRKFHHEVLGDMELSMKFLLKSLPYLPVNTLVVNGVDDVFLTDESLALVRQHVAGVRVRQLPECGHVPFLEKPRLLASTYLKHLNEVSLHPYEAGVKKA